MTIGIAVAGPCAGLAAFRALALVEAVSRGAIGGFVSFAVLDTNGALLRAETQRGGTRTLFTAGERTGVEPRDAFREAPLAVLMSSGPDRPEPLSQFTPGRAGVGLVTGHRLPNMPGVDGTPLNQNVLRRLVEGVSPEAAVTAELERNPEADAGLIAVDAAGRMHLGNTAAVAARTDIGTAMVDDPETGMRVAVLHNAIFPHRGLAWLAVSGALDSIAPGDRADFTVEILAGTRLELGTENALHLHADGGVSHITVTQQSWFAARRDGAALGYAAPVRRDGMLVGRISFEPYCVVEQGRLVSMSGRDRVSIGIRAEGKAPAATGAVPETRSA
jgi:hypothetical protein